MQTTQNNATPVMVIITYNDGGIKILPADEFFNGEIRDTDMADEM